MIVGVSCPRFKSGTPKWRTGSKVSQLELACSIHLPVHNTISCENAPSVLTSFSDIALGAQRAWHWTTRAVMCEQLRSCGFLARAAYSALIFVVLKCIFKLRPPITLLTILVCVFAFEILRSYLGPLSEGCRGKKVMWQSSSTVFLISSLCFVVLSICKNDTTSQDNCGMSFSEYQKKKPSVPTTIVRRKIEGGRD